MVENERIANPHPCSRRFRQIAGIDVRIKWKSRQRQKTVGKPAPHPQSGHGGGFRRYVQHVEGAKRDELDSPRQGLARLLEQIHGRRSEDQEAAGPVAAPPAPVDDAAQLREQPGGAVDLVENDQAILVLGEEQPRVGELRPAGGRFEVQVQRTRPPARCRGRGSSCPPDVARSGRPRLDGPERWRRLHAPGAESSSPI